MRYCVCLMLFLTACMLTNSSVAQKNDKNQMDQYKQKFGVKGGYNYSTLHGSTPTFNADSKNGFMVAAFYSAGGGTGMGYRTELVYSRQGYSYDSTNTKINVRQDYIYLPQFT